MVRMALTVLDRTPTGSIARIAAGTPSYRRLVGLLAAGGLANFAIIYFPQPLLPAIAASFGVDAGASGLTISATTAAMLLGLLLSAPLSDRIGRVSAMSGSLVMAGILSVACAFAPTWEAFLALRAAGGLALAVTPSATTRTDAPTRCTSRARPSAAPWAGSRRCRSRPSAAGSS